ncbi:hypothetical protein MMC26_006322, partial [Xylographa opegraphella]|nr:hypothetical protein [Xylographa opegraphella]
MKFTTTFVISCLSFGTFALAKQFPNMQRHQNYDTRKRSAMAAAEAYAYASPQFHDGEVDLFSRDADPEAYDEEYEIFRRGAFPDSLPDTDGLFERDADADAEPEEWVEKEFYIIPRDAEAEAYAEAIALPWTPKINVNGGKITKDTLKCNKKD